MNSNTPFGKRTSLAKRKLPERMEILMESRDSWIFREVGSQTLPRSKSRFEYTNASIARRRIRIRHVSASES